MGAQIGTVAVLSKHVQTRGKAKEPQNPKQPKEPKANNNLKNLRHLKTRKEAKQPKQLRKLFSWTPVELTARTERFGK